MAIDITREKARKTALALHAEARTHFSAGDQVAGLTCELAAAVGRFRVDAELHGNSTVEALVRFACSETGRERAGAWRVREVAALLQRAELGEILGIQVTSDGPVAAVPTETVKPDALN